MLHLRSLESCHLDASWVTIGSFDGIHLGHQTIIKQLVENAHLNGLPTVVITFFPHPAVVLGKIEQIYYLTSPEEKAVLLGQLGIDFVITLTFDNQIASLTCRQFIQMAKKHLGMQSLWAGHDFALGKNRQGNISTLGRYGIKYGFSINVIEAVKIGGNSISSSKIRGLLKSGQVKLAAEMLGRHYVVAGVIVHGDERGRKIGFPTANLKIWEERLLPQNGVYITWAIIDGKKMPSVTNIGTRPTFNKEKLEARVETHILDYENNIYGREMEVEFIQFIRPEMSFSNIQDLTDQISMDINQANTYFSSPEKR